MPKNTKESSSDKGDFRSARAAVWRELTVVREATTGRFTESLIKKPSNTKIGADRLQIKK